MKNKIFITTLIITAFYRFSIAQNNLSLNSQNEPKQAINICALAIPLLNLYVVNYEYLYQSKHGLAVRIEYAPKMKGADTKGVAWAGVLNYRWHFSPKLKNFFIGPYIRYRYVYGSGNTSNAKFDFDVSELNIGFNGGYRWVSTTGINVVLAAGYGYSIDKENLSPSDEDINSVFSKFKNANDTNKSLLDAPFYGEVSVGYAF